MLFNSYVFLFGFLPVTLVLFFVLGRHSRSGALAWLILASLVFYAWWRPINVLIIAPSIAVNFALARWLQRPAEGARQESLRQWALGAGIVFNIAFLGYFKYANFVVGAVNDVGGTHFVLEQIILPLGISFITFQKIAFLVDVWSRRVVEFSLADYALFVLFFPQLIAGPIVHYREMMPQFRAATCRANAEDLAVGLTLLAFGLFKKVVLADTMAAWVSPVYLAAASGQTVSLVPAWIAAAGFTLQIYFDFSGYSDMAIGLARCFGVRLPANFDSPLKATNIIDFWLRWHMTLTRFLTAYLYNPLVLRLTRRRLARGLAPFGGRNTSVSAFVQLLALPTLFTMLVSGVWHGAGYLYIAWGLVHGAYLAVNHAWRAYVVRHVKDREAYTRRMRVPAAVLTFVSVVVAMVLFRAPEWGAARRILAGLVGAGGLELPRSLLTRLGAALPADLVGAAGALETTMADWAAPLGWMAILLAIAWTMPNTMQLLAHHEPALGVRAEPRPRGWLARIRWRPRLGWAMLAALLAGAALMRMGGRSEFLYWQF